MTLKLLVVHPGASWSTADVFTGLCHGLEHHGVSLIPYRLDQRIALARKTLGDRWRQAKRTREVARPSNADVFYHAGVGALEMALRHQVDAVVVVSAMFLHPDVLILMKRAGLKVFVLFTESPYDLEHEIKVAALVDGGWTNERSSVPAFRAVNARMGYLPHGWNPEVHRADALMVEAPAHDVVFVGTGFAERIEWFNAIDWSGIDLGLYGMPKRFGLKQSLVSCLHSQPVANAFASSLYRRAKIGLNLYRERNSARMRVSGESLSPRAYELAAVGAFHVSAYRAEVAEVFGPLVPTFTTPGEAERLIRQWLGDDEGRANVARQLPACVAEASWVQRASTVLGDLRSALVADAAA